MKKIVTVLGARPQFIKAAAVSRAISREPKLIEFIVHTGQHYDYNMSDLFFEELKIPKPYVNLHIGSGTHGYQTAEMLKLIEDQLVRLSPDLVLVYGDTNSTLAGALAASKLHIPVAHVEAGLRSFNKRMPEEINRIITDHISDVLFPPTQTASYNLRRENISTEKTFQVGDVMYDAVLFYQDYIKNSRILNKLKLDSPYILLTIHRAENTDDISRLKTILSQLEIISNSMYVVFPIHPRTQKLLKGIVDLTKFKRLKLTEPVGYLDMLSLQRSSALIITDSGGIQKEAFMNGKYCLTLRSETEWSELVEHKVNFLVHPLNMLCELVEKTWGQQPDSDFRPYGDGFAASKIVEVLKDRY